MTAIAVLACGLCAGPTCATPLSFTIHPAAPGEQLVRVALPLPRGFLETNRALVVAGPDGVFRTTGLRVLSWHPAKADAPRTARRALVTFPWDFSDLRPVTFTAETARARSEKTKPLPVSLHVSNDLFQLEWRDRRRATLRLLAPPVAHTATPPRIEIVEDNPFFRWLRIHVADEAWPRVVEFRFDALGGVLAVAHLQRGQSNDWFAPELGWELEMPARGAALQVADKLRLSPREPLRHRFAEGVGASCLLDGALAVHFPDAPFLRRGAVEVAPREPNRWACRYLRCGGDERVPMQWKAWRRAVIALARPGVAPVTAARVSPHRLQMSPEAWAALYELQPHPRTLPPELERLVRYHRDAIVRSAAVGDDFGNVTAFNDTSAHGAAFGMNRLNHGAAIFESGWRAADARLTETALRWCDNFYDLSIWWGERQRGGTRYNNVPRQGPATDREFMWRSDSAVTFCTKGFDCFWLAWEETGDPRMLEALRAQVDYARQFVHANQGECRNVGAARDFLQLYQATGDTTYRNEALRLFRELRTKLAPDHLFDQGGKPLDPDPPYIEEDERGLKTGYAKPYIIGYALLGLPELLRFAPDEPGLKETVRAVADFLATTVDPSGGWRYPHPRSSRVLINQGLEHAWQLSRAARALGPEPKWLDAIETVLRARVQAWLRSGRLLSGLEGWELSTGRVKDARELYELYRKPADRDARRDYTEGRISLGSAPPEGLVYFEDVLAFYLEHRPASRLLEPPRPDEPLGQILARLPEPQP
ncbi:MAG: hypothetical protein RMK20_05005 [Verrucomicrobiales bacterium]|nr:hypothetical protein [Verrucomicrobiales bacterium]